MQNCSIPWNYKTIYYESEIIESVAKRTDEEIDDSNLTKELHYYVQHLLNINIALVEDILKTNASAPSLTI